MKMITNELRINALVRQAYIMMLQIHLINLADPL